MKRADAGRFRPWPPAAARGAASLGAAAAIAAAAAAFAGSAPWDAALGAVEVSPDGAGLVAGQKPVVFACADLGRDLPKDEAAAAALAENLWTSGFDMVRLEALAAATDSAAGDSAAESPEGSAADAFVAACRALGVRIWAEALEPVAEAAVSPSDAALVDEPSTFDAWTNAVSEALARPDGEKALALAAAWDPRLEVALQRRVRAWGRSFNPMTGSRRCEDPAFALFSFSSTWLDEMAAPDRRPLPEFFEASLRQWWGNWLYERHGDDAAIAAALGGLLPGETVASNTIAFPPLDPADTNRTAAFRNEQKLFLHNLDLEHMRCVVEPFTLLGPTARLAPRLVSHSSGRSIPKLSTIDLRQAGKERKAPLAWPAPEGRAPASEARAAAAAKASVFVQRVPVSGIDAFSPDGGADAADAAALFHALSAPEGQDPPSEGGPAGSAGVDLPQYARAGGEFERPSGTNSLACAVSFPLFGAEARFVGGSGQDARAELEAMCSASNAAPLLVVVHLPEDKAAPRTGDAEAGDAAETEGEVSAAADGGEGDGVAPTAPRRFAWSLLCRRDEASGAIPLSVSLRDADGGEPLPAGLLVGGSAVARKSLAVGAGRDDGAGQSLMPENGTFRHAAPAGGRALVFRPAIIAPALSQPKILAP